MKKTLLLLFLCTSLLQGKAQNLENEFFNDIQDKVQEAFLASTEKKDSSSLILLETRLQEFTPKTFLSQYWSAYAKFYESVYYIKYGNKKQSNHTIKETIDLLEKMEPKNAESYALLGHAQNFSIQFTSGMGAGMVSNEVKKNAKKSLEMDSTNVRAWYVLASNDFYTPKIFGGGKKAEEYLLKAVSQKEQPVSNIQMPSWGKSDSYALLVSYYFEKENLTEAKKVLAEALALYPEDYMLKEQVKTLNEKRQ